MPALLDQIPTSPGKVLLPLSLQIRLQLDLFCKHRAAMNCMIQDVLYDSHNTTACSSVMLLLAPDFEVQNTAEISWTVKLLVDALGALQSQPWCKPSTTSRSTWCWLQRQRKISLTGMHWEMSMTSSGGCAQPWTLSSVPRQMILVSTAFLTSFHSSRIYWARILRRPKRFVVGPPLVDPASIRQ